MSARSLTAGALILALLLSTGCDEIALFDVTPSGRLLVAADAQGVCALAGGVRPRHLFLVDPRTGVARRLTRRPRLISWPTACGERALFVENGRRLVLLSASGEERHLYTARKGYRLLQPLAAPHQTHVAVVEATELGRPGTLLVISLATGEVVHRVERALIGAVWTHAGLIVGRALGPKRARYASGPGEVIRIDREFSSHVLFRGALPPFSALTAAGPDAVIAALQTSGPAGPLALARLDTHARHAQHGERGSFDFWPACDAAGKRLLFTRSSAKRRSLQGELRVAPTGRPEDSRVVPTGERLAAAPRWVGARRIAYLTDNDHLVVQDLDGGRRIDLTSTLRSAYAAATATK